MVLPPTQKAFLDQYVSFSINIFFLTYTGTYFLKYKQTEEKGEQSNTMMDHDGWKARIHKVRAGAR